MKKFFVKSFAIAMAIMMILVAAVPFVSAATLLDDTQKVSVTVSCDKSGYTFELFEVAALKTKTDSPYETYYDPLFNDIKDEVKSGNTKNILLKLDEISPALDPMPATAVSCGTFSTVGAATATSKTFDNLEQGIYYIKCTRFPAGVKAVENSVVALPYYQNNSWVYSIDTVNLATKVEDDTPETEKEITNSTRNNVNFTDVSIGDTVNFALYNTTAGSTAYKLETYTVKDKMSKGLTFDKNSVKVYLADSSKAKIADLTANDFKLNVTAEGDGKDTEFNVALNKTYLAKNDFYADNVEYVIVTYSAKLNKHAVKGAQGNPNDDIELEYGNKSAVDSVPGNRVYVYTYGVNVMKKNENGSALSGAKFGIYKTNADAENKANALGIGVSDTNGNTAFLNAAEEEIRLESGNYFIAEIEAPEGYNIYGKVIPVSIDVTYHEAIANETWVENAPADGTAIVTVTDTKLIVPQTGGYVVYLYIAGAVSLLIGGVLFFISRKIKAQNK